MTRQPTTTQRGLGWAHQQQRRRLLARHRDGTPCPCLDDPAAPCGPACPCRKAGTGLPMYRDAARNVDGAPLEADHTLARSRGGTKADRLMLRICNRSRGDGTRTTQQPARPDWWTRTWYDAPPDRTHAAAGTPEGV